MTREMTFKTAWGWVGIAASEKGITSIHLSPAKRQASPRQEERGAHEAATALIEEARSQLLAYIQGTRRDFSLPVDLSAGTSFQRKVWKAIARIPYGRVRSYQWVASRVAGNTMPGRWAWRLAPIQCLLWCLVIGLLRTTARWADSPAGCR